jgi:hypothetical protein
MSDRASFRRVLLDLCHATADRGGIRVAAELARLLDLDLTGVFVEDTALLGLAEYPFARELRLPGHEWQKLDPERIVAEVHEAAATARRLLDAHSAPLGIHSLFEVVRGDPSASVAALSGIGDIVVLVEPATPSDRLARAFPRAWQSALRSAAAVLLVPPRIVRLHGPVAAVITRAGDPSLATAAAIAAAAGEQLLLLLLPRDDDLKTAAVAGARAVGLPDGRIHTHRLRAATPQAVVHALGPTQERLVVMTRAAGALPDTAPSHLAAARRVPVLVVEPDAVP